MYESQLQAVPCRERYFLVAEQESTQRTQLGGGTDREVFRNCLYPASFYPAFKPSSPKSPSRPPSVVGRVSTFLNVSAIFYYTLHKYCDTERNVATGRGRLPRAASCPRNDVITRRFVPSEMLRYRAGPKDETIRRAPGTNCLRGHPRRARTVSRHCRGQMQKPQVIPAALQQEKRRRK